MTRNAIPPDVFDPEARVLLGSRCGRCAAIHFPPLPGCPDCFAEATERVPLSQAGRVRSFTFVNLAFPGFPPSYPLVEVQLPEGIVVLGQLAATDPTQVQVGMTVTVDAGPIRIDDQGEPLHGYRFVPGGPT